jgi:glycosyltransferase involved in cell wall biosynthesis
MARFALEPPLAHIPFVLDMVDVDSAKWRELAASGSMPMSWIYGREGRTLEAFEADAVRQARATLVVNARERDVLARITPGADVQVVENGIDVDLFLPPASATRAASVIFCGVLDYSPNESGVRWFLEDVWPRVHGLRPDARFVIVGANPTRALKRAAARTPAVDLVGATPAVQPHLWQSAVSIAPLHLARGLQNKVLEALASGLPVVATRAVAEGLPVEARRGIVEADSAEVFVDAVVRLLNQTNDARARLAAAADLTSLSWRARLSRLEHILHAAVG